MSHVIISNDRIYGRSVIMGSIGVKDRFGDSGAPWKLVKEFEVSAEHIALKVAQLMAVKKAHEAAEEERLTVSSLP